MVHGGTKRNEQRKMSNDISRSREFKTGMFYNKGNDAVIQHCRAHKVIDGSMTSTCPKTKQGKKNKKKKQVAPNIYFFTKI